MYIRTYGVHKTRRNYYEATDPEPEENVRYSNVIRRDGDTESVEKSA